MTAMIDTPPARPGAGKRLLAYPPVKILLAIVLVLVASKLVFALAEAIADKEARLLWPEVIAAIVVLLTYGAYVRHVEKRPAAELSRPGALPEFGAGLLIGASMVTVQVGILYALGYYELAGVNAWTMKLIQPLAVMLFIGVVEEVIGRGIIFRITEESLGSRPAILLSALLFGLAHLPGEGADIMAIGITMVAGAFFAAAYMLTRRLWLCIGIHAAWNYTMGSIFSVAVSGRESKGLLVGTLTGPDWVTGGSYGLEASLPTLLVLVLVGGCFFWLARARGGFAAPKWRRASGVVA
ncbi:MAG: type II CAAX endopeptidase family protein [Telluria sp.]